MLIDFVKDLFETGKIKVAKEMTDFSENDKEIALEILSRYFETYSKQFPNSHTLNFNVDTAFWAIDYLYKLCQVLLLRELSDEQVLNYLPKYTHKQSRNEVFSVDLIFQFIPELFRISKELSPADVVTHEMKELANTWSFSLFEIAENMQVGYIENDPVLLDVFCNRIIEKNYTKAIISETIKNNVLTHIGNHSNSFWKEIESIEIKN